MKIIIKEYLLMLKESKELDALLPDLLLSMDIKPFSKAQIGVRQYGVDVAAVGKDDDEIEKVFLFTIKQGDIGRRDWNDGEQAIRPSLDEIKDVYIPTSLGKEYQNMPKKIILCTSGDLKQEVQPNWNGYIANNSSDNMVKYDFWGGDKLALLIKDNLFTEQIIPAELRAKLRKTIALLGDADYDLRDYFSLINELLFESNLARKNQKHMLKTLRLLHLCMNIVFYWAKNEDNLKPALLTAERTVLNIWEFIRINCLHEDKKIQEIFWHIYNSLNQVQYEYFTRLQVAYNSENGMIIYGRHFIQKSVLLFEQLGIIASIGIVNLVDGIFSKQNNMFENARIVSDTIKSIIHNHKTLLSPVYDEHIIDISLALFLLQSFNEVEFIENWVRSLLEHINYAYDIYGKYFPIDTDSFEDLVDLSYGHIDKSELMRMSTLLPTLSCWCLSLGMIENYKMLVNIVKKTFSDTTLQTWYPDDQTEQYMYKTNAGYRSGFTFGPILLPESLSLLNEQVKLVFEKTIKLEDLSCVKYQMGSLFFISNRHFRMPIFPHIWEYNIK